MTAASGLPFEDLRVIGLLWLINTTVFHPRGYALALHFDDQGHATGWSILGDGTEPWSFDHDASKYPEGSSIDDLFKRASTLLSPKAGGA